MTAGGNTASVLKALDGTGINLTSDTFVDDVLAAGATHQKVSQFLASLPGYPNDPAKAVEQLEAIARLVKTPQSVDLR